jgi:signal transduction histidine kinase
LPDYSKVHFKRVIWIFETLKRPISSIARDLHDTLGHDMTGLIMQIEMGTRLLEDEDQHAEGLELLEAAKKSARDSMAKVRQIVQALKTGEMETWSVTSIQRLIDTFSEKTGVKIHLSIVGEHVVTPDISIALYRLIQEGLTNSVRHGKATQVAVDIIFDEEKLSVKIEDNGRGCKHMKKGNGIKGMEERVEQLGGEIDLTCKSGFTVIAYIPYYND